MASKIAAAAEQVDADGGGLRTLPMASFIGGRSTAAPGVSLGKALDGAAHTGANDIIHGPADAKDRAQGGFRGARGDDDDDDAADAEAEALGRGLAEDSVGSSPFLMDFDEP